MRMTVPLILAAALAAATPALAQDANNTADANMAAPMATDANAVAPVATDANATVPVAEPAAPAVDETTAPAPEEKKGGFPWGVLGVLGLIGLIPRKGR
jgi:hypothetical protein